VAVVRSTGTSLGQSRHFFGLFIPAVLLIFVLIATLGDRVRVAWLAFTLIFCAASLVYLYQPMTKYGNWDQVANYVMEKEAPGQPILIFHAGNALTFGHYYQGPNILIPVPRENRFDTFDIRDYVLTSESQISELVDRKGGAHERAWLVTDGVCGFMDVDYHCQILDDFVARNYVVESTAVFATSKVRLLRRK
jgi:hypothetical protein